jgi:nucleoside-diphosphate-sugar epimerase
VQTTKTSVHGAINMLGLAKRLDAKIFQASTSEVYGDPTVHPQTEDYRGHVSPPRLISMFHHRPMRSGASACQNKLYAFLLHQARFRSRR